MGKKFEETALASSIFTKTNEFFGFENEADKLQNVMIDGPIKKLGQTEYTQPAMLIDGYVKNSKK